MMHKAVFSLIILLAIGTSEAAASEPSAEHCKYAASKYWRTRLKCDAATTPAPAPTSTRVANR
jgi:hypothetical protein